MKSTASLKARREAAWTAGMGLDEYDYWSKKQATATAAAKRKKLIADRFEAPDRKTQILEKLGLRNLQGLPPAIRSRLLVLAYYEKAGRAWTKLRELVEPLILSHHEQSVKVESLKNLVGQEPKKLQLSLIILEKDEGERDYVNGTTLRLPTKHDRHDSLSLSRSPRRSELETSSYIIDAMKPQNNDEVRIIELTDWINESNRACKLYDLVTESDEIPVLPETLRPKYHSSRPRKAFEVLLRAADGTLWLLRDTYQTGILLIPPVTIDVWNLGTRKPEQPTCWIHREPERR